MTIQNRIYQSMIQGLGEASIVPNYRDFQFVKPIENGKPPAGVPGTPYQGPPDPSQVKPEDFGYPSRPWFIHPDSWPPNAFPPDNPPPMPPGLGIPPGHQWHFVYPNGPNQPGEWQLLPDVDPSYQDHPDRLRSKPEEERDKEFSPYTPRWHTIPDEIEKYLDYPFDMWPQWLQDWYHDHYYEI